MTNVLLEKKGPYAVATIHRPEALNALNSQVLADLAELLDTVEADEEIRALVITPTRRSGRWSSPAPGRRHSWRGPTSER